MQLNKQQQNALDSMLSFIDSDKQKFVLKGYAGTGKTTTIQHLLSMLSGDTKVVFTAPTHKAVKVLQKMARERNIAVDLMTIHSLLGLTVRNVKDKQVLDKNDSKNEDTVFNYDIIVVDECSMISRELFSYIEDTIERNFKIKYIFMGDPAQLPPVGEHQSIVFDDNDIMCELTQVMRQRDESPVLGVCTDIRTAYINKESKIPSISSFVGTDKNGVRVLDTERWQSLFLKAFDHNVFDADPDRTRVIAWRNSTVNKINDAIHNLRYPNCKGWLAHDEPICFIKPLINRSLVEPDMAKDIDSIIVNTDFEGSIISCKKECYPAYKDIPSWLIKCEIESGATLEFYALDRRGAVIKNKKLNEIAKNIKKENLRGQDAWKPYYNLINSYADIRPAYCLTAHKSQGSTFDNVFIDVDDIKLNKNKSEVLRCLYVAASRARNNLIIKQQVIA